jgi:hypothetical protein
VKEKNPALHRKTANRLVPGTHGRAQATEAAVASSENAAFKDAGSGRLMVVLDGQVRITKEQVQMLSKQVKERIAKQ